MASLLSSVYSPCSHFPRTNPNPRLLHPFTLPLKHKACCSSLAIAALPTSSSSSSPPSLFFARLSGATSASLSAPLAVVALTAVRCLNLYTTLLTVRVLLSWFPNISWDRQPFSAIRDLCDPYLALFRSIMPIPRLFGTLDLSPLLAFAVLHFLASFLTARCHC